MKCGLLGRKLSHSYSPMIHAYLGNYSYELVEVEPDKLESVVRSPEFRGLNVTIPYKKSVLPLCDCLTEAAEKLGAVNTIIHRSGRTIGHNSDYTGFSVLLTTSGLCVEGRKVLVLGSGGSSVTVQCVLREKGALPVVISRSGENNYTNLHRHADAAVIVNCTPVGMYPGNGSTPVDLGQFPNLEGVIDLIYNPARTKLLFDAEKRGLIAINGLTMLVAQGKESAECFLGRKIHADIPKIACSVAAKTENILLIGMPGCGKSTIAALLAEALGRSCLDTDDLVAQTAGRPVAQILNEDGEAAFRKLETKVLEQVTRQSGIVIASGGGCVSVDGNRLLLRQNSKIIWLQRDLQRLSTVGRPLSQKTSLEALYLQREQLYKQISDLSVDNNGSTDETVKAILSLLETR